MKIVGNKKAAILITVGFIFLIVLIAVGIIYLSGRKKYPEEPLLAQNLGTSEVELDISNMKRDMDITDVPVYSVKPNLHISDVEEMINQVGLSLERKDIVKDSYIEWSNEENMFTYDSVLDTLTFQISESISIERGVEGFSNIFSRYFDIEYEFTLVQEKKNADGGITYYASRMVGEVPIQFGSKYEYSDILKFDKEGNLESGSLLLAEIKEYDYYLPLITQRELVEFVNLNEYPKEYHLDTGVLMDFLEIDYLDDQWEDIEKSVSDCNGGDSELVFLFKNSNQGALLPVFKISSICKVYKSNLEYSVPAIFYVNAVNPKYVTL
jgi:hypothetical protein